MAYNTKYKLTIEPQAEVAEWSTKEIVRSLRDISFDSRFALSDNLNTEEPCNWYEQEKEMAALSKLYPEFLFKLYGYGEDATDIWVKYFLNGKVQTCIAEMILPDFDIFKMRNVEL